jgi:hypothetical protein
MVNGFYFLISIEFFFFLCEEKEKGSVSDNNSGMVPR